MKRAGDEDSSRFREFCRTTRIYASIAKQLIALPFQRKIQLIEPQQVLRQRLGDDELEVVRFATGKLVKWGDNYGSTIVKAMLDVRRRGGVAERLHLVAKMLPPTDFQRESFQCETTIAKEIFLYERIIPAYRELYRDCGQLDIVPEFYGGRLALKPDAAGVDEGAVILLQNLREAGYVMEERLQGLTPEHVKIAVPAIAKFHAIGLAIKQKNPEFFARIAEYAKPLELRRDVLRIFVNKMLQLIKSKRQLSAYYERAKSLNRVDSAADTFLEYLEPDEPWACLVHRDMWINNVMFHRSETDQSVDDFKLLDFQSYCLASPMTDLLYFLFSSLPREFEHFDAAVSLYRETAHRSLIDLGCEATAALFEGPSFDERLARDAKSELYHCVLIARNVETRSGWDMMKLSDASARRILRIFEVYEDKGWF